MKYGYCRVSSTGQTYGTSLDDQEQKLREQGAESIFREAYTGTNRDRPEFAKLLSVLEPGDCLMVTKMDRFARSAQDALTLINELQQRGVDVHILNMGLVDDTPIGKLSISILAAFAEFEVAMIVERTQTGKAIAKQNPDFREGRPPVYSKKQVAHALELLDEGKTYRQVEELTGMSKSTLIRARNKQKIEKLTS